MNDQRRLIGRGGSDRQDQSKQKQQPSRAREPWTAASRVPALAARAWMEYRGHGRSSSSATAKDGAIRKALMPP